MAKIQKIIGSKKPAKSFFQQYSKADKKTQRSAIAEFITSYNYFTQSTHTIINNTYESCPSKEFKTSLKSAHSWLGDKKTPIPKSCFKSTSDKTKKNFDFQKTPLVTAKFWGQRLSEMSKNNWLGSLLGYYYIEGIFFKDEWQNIAELANKNKLYGTELNEYFQHHWPITQPQIETELTSLYDQSEDKEQFLADAEQLIQTAFKVRQNYWQQLSQHIDSQYQEQDLKIAS